ncbi:J domain-containing protein [Myxococcota bacterium]|nr:J domain-containing protein [Myxococcota bacterium]
MRQMTLKDNLLPLLAHYGALVPPHLRGAYTDAALPLSALGRDAEPPLFYRDRPLGVLPQEALTHAWTQHALFDLTTLARLCGLLGLPATTALALLLRAALDVGPVAEYTQRAILALLHHEAGLFDPEQTPGQWALMLCADLQGSEVLETPIFAFKGDAMIIEHDPAGVKPPQPRLSPALHALARRYEAQCARFVGGSDEDIARFWTLSQQRRDLKDQLGDVRREIDGERLAWQHLQARFLDAMGEDHVEVQRLLLRQRQLSAILDVLEADPDARPEEVEADVLAQMAAELAAQRALEMHMAEIRLSRRFMIISSSGGGGGGGGGSSHEAHEQASEVRVKAIYREIALLTHPDRLAHDPRFQALSEAQRAEIAARLKAAQEIRDVERVGDPRQRVKTTRNLWILEGILAEIKHIFAHSGLPLPIDEEILGETLADQLRFLSDERAWLLSAIQMERARLNQMLNDPEAQRKAALLQDPEALRMARQRLGGHRAALESAVDVLEVRWAVARGVAQREIM